MGFGAGHMQDMNNRLKQNRESKTSNKAKFKDSQWSTRYDKENDHRTMLEFVELNEEELYYYKLEIRKKALKRRRLQNILLLSIAIITLASLIAFYINFG